MKKFDLKKNWKQIFDKDGNWRMKGYSPMGYNSSTTSEKEWHEFHDILFDEDGYTNINSEEIMDLIIEQKWGPFCSAVQYYYSIDIPNFTRGNYTSIYSWR